MLTETSMAEMIYEINHILHRGYEIKYSYDFCSYECNFNNCVALLDFISAVQYMIHFIYHFVH